jgi:hypothetical protein
MANYRLQKRADGSWDIRAEYRVKGAVIPAGHGRAKDLDDLWDLAVELHGKVSGIRPGKSLVQDTASKAKEGE